ncbi:hypothetical protein WJX73_005924 [Symbiochloris irregularis]|uniref:CCR4-NOT transcription complex subunit 11 n=1 Tax=Symbiochloris irregularis TaxID=706552 RepID=A0AAW1PZ59_9CHLO
MLGSLLFRLGVVCADLPADRQEQERLAVSQRLSAVFLVADIGRPQPITSNIFLPVLEQVLAGAQNTAEQSFLAQLLLAYTQVAAATPLQVLAWLACSVQRSLPSLATALHQLRRAAADRSVDPSSQRRQEKEKGTAGEQPALPTDLLVQNGSFAADPAQQEADQDAYSAVMHPRPRPLRPTLPRLPLQPGELRWLHPQLEHPLVWDAHLGPLGERVSALTQILQRSLLEPLPPALAKQAEEEVDADACVALRCGLTPACLSALIEHNQSIAQKVLAWLVQRSAAEEWLEVLAGMDMSVHSMEVVNWLTSNTHLPPAFLQRYIHNCIAFCRRPQDSDKVQSRLVRLLSVFLTSLIRNRVVAVGGVFLEVQAFCIEFSRIREAANLFRLLKQLESDQQMSDGNLDFT